MTARLDTSTQVLNDKESVTGDPLVANNAYAVWDQLVSPNKNANPSAFVHSIAFRGPTLFSRTTDKGVTWSQGRVIFDPGQNDQTIGNQIVVPTTGPAEGVLIDGMSLITNQGGKCPIVFIVNQSGHPSKCGKGSTFTAAVIRSTDGGNTWSGRRERIDTQQVASVSIAGRRCARATSSRSSPPTPSTGTSTRSGRTPGSARPAPPRSPSRSPPMAD